MCAQLLDTPHTLNWPPHIHTHNWHMPSLTCGWLHMWNLSIQRVMCKELKLKLALWRKRQIIGTFQIQEKKKLPKVRFQNLPDKNLSYKSGFTVFAQLTCTSKIWEPFTAFVSWLQLILLNSAKPHTCAHIHALLTTARNHMIYVLLLSKLICFLAYFSYFSCRCYTNHKIEIAKWTKSLQLNGLSHWCDMLVFILGHVFPQKRIESQGTCLVFIFFLTHISEVLGNEKEVRK